MSLYEVQGITLIPQKLENSCWYASAQMLIQWKMDKELKSMARLIPPEYDFECQLIRDVDKGIQNSQILPMAVRLGLKEIRPQSLTPEGLENLLRHYGPLWVNGKSHIVVLGGINTRDLSVKVYDPGNGGSIEWRSLVTWYTFGVVHKESSRDTSSAVDAVFLYVPIHV